MELKAKFAFRQLRTFLKKRFAPGATVYAFQKGKDPVALTVKSHRKHKQFDLLSFEGMEDINLVEPLKQADLKIAEDQQDDLADGEYYYHQIVGLNVVDLDGNSIGKIKEIMESGANDVWVIQRAGEKDLLIPAIKDVVKDVQIENHQVIIDMLDGLDD